jgi:hypothetical protein
VHKNHTRTWTHTREEQNDVGQQSDADDTHSTASSASTASIISSSTTSAGTSQTSHTIGYILFGNLKSYYLNVINYRSMYCSKEGAK